MTMKREAVTQKLMVLGVDGMDPRLTTKYVNEGKMPNVKKLMEKGSCREDLVLLGANPTVTPPMWTTLATGAYPMTHGITAFWRHSKEKLHVMEYNLDSRNCTAEPVWNCFAEAGKKTLVWHWPGSSWPPTSDSEKLYVVDGTSPGNVCMSTCQVEDHLIIRAGENVKEASFIKEVADDAVTPCVITGLGAEKDEGDGFDISHAMQSDELVIILLNEGDGSVGAASYDGGGEEKNNTYISPIKPAVNWVNAPEDAKEFDIAFSAGLVRRPCLILKNEIGIYDKVAIYKSKKETEPITVLELGRIIPNVRDIAIVGDTRYEVIRNIRLLYLAEDGSALKIWSSAANRIDNAADIFHPRRIYQDLEDNIGYVPPTAELGFSTYDLMKECALDNWYLVADWQAACIHYLIEHEGIETIFSHYHNVDLLFHHVARSMKGNAKQSAEFYAARAEEIYVQTDYYIGKFMHLLDEGWTIMLVSDHAQVCPQHSAVFGLGDILGVNVQIMEELGFTVLKHDENGKRLREIDWEKTKAIAIRENDIYINVKGRWATGIVEPEDQYEVEEEVMTALYGYKHPKTGKRVVALALRNKDAAVLGLGGPECGDIIYFTAEGYNYDHADGLSTTYGMADTSLSPIFIGAGPGFKENFRTPMMLRQVDVAPTAAILGGVRIPAQCEGAPMYSILTVEV